MENNVNKYKVIKKIGQGGMGAVYLGQDKVLDRPVAIKVIPPEYTSSREFVERFLKEARICAKLDHPGIVKIYDFGKIESKNQLYFVMQYIEGESLTDAMKKAGILSDKQILLLSKRILKSLKCAHENGIIHRDIKPDNILIDKNGYPVLTDFGIAKVIHTPGLTQDGTAMGTPEYMSPEQVLGQELNNQTDIYSYGILMYKMATGILPFNADTPVAIAIKQVNEFPTAPSKINQNVDSRLEKIILKCIDKNKNTRYKNVDEVICDLETIENEIKAGTNITESGETSSVTATVNERLSTKQSGTLKISTIQETSATAKIDIEKIIKQAIIQGRLNFISLIFESIECNDRDTIKFLIDTGADLDAHNEKGNTPLIYAIRCNNFPIVEFLLDNGANPNFKNAQDKTPLMICVEIGNQEMIKTLLDNGADINIKNEKSENVLTIAQTTGKSDVLNLLLNYSPQIVREAGTITERTAVNGSIDVKEVLLEAIKKNELDLESEIFYAVENSNIPIIKLLLKKGLFNVNSKNNAGNTLLVFAAKFGNADLIKYFIENGADPNSTNENGDTAIIVAAFYGKLDIVKALATYSDLKFKNIKNKTALDYAIEKGHSEIAKYVSDYLKAKEPSIINKLFGLFKK